MIINRNENKELHEKLFNPSNYEKWGHLLKEFVEEHKSDTTDAIPAWFIGTDAISVSDSLVSEFKEWISSKGIEL